MHAALESSFAQLTPDEASWRWGAKALEHVRSCPGCARGRCLLGLSRAEPALLDDCMAAVRLAAEVAEDEARLWALVPAAAGRDSVYTLWKGSELADMRRRRSRQSVVSRDVSLPAIGVASGQRSWRPAS